MYADDLLLISPTCSDLRRTLRAVFSKLTVYNTVTFNTSVFFWYRYTAHP